MKYQNKGFLMGEPIHTMTVIVKKLNTCVLILPPSDLVIQREVYRRRRETQALAGTTFPEGLTPFLCLQFPQMCG